VKNKEKNIDTVKLSHLDKMVKTLKAKNKKDIDISFEFIIASCFPRCFKNIQDSLKEQYTLGYIQGLNEKTNTNLKNSE
jgi:hypothetical protein